MARTLRLDDGWLIDWTLTDQLGDTDVFTKLEGWYGGSDIRTDKTARWQDGTYLGHLWREGRQLTIAGYHKIDCTLDPEYEADRLRRAISGAFKSGSRSPGTVRVTEHSTGVTLECLGVQLDGRPKFTLNLPKGRVDWELPLMSGDPYLYEVMAPGADSVSASPLGPGSGLEFPLFDDEETGTTTGFLEWTGIAAAAAGTAHNFGNAVAYPRIIVEGTFPSGFRLTLTGDGPVDDLGAKKPWEVTYRGDVSPASPVTIDMAGTILINDVDQSWALSDPHWGGVDPGGSVTFDIEPISVGAGTATLQLRSTYL